MLFLLLAAFDLAATLFVPANSLRWLALAAGCLVWTLVVSGINRSGRPWDASVAQTVSCWVALSCLAWTGGGTMAPSVCAYVVVVLMAGSLLGWRAAIYSGILCSLTLLALVLAERLTILPPSMVAQTSAGRWLANAFVLMMAGGLQYLSSKSSKDALRMSEQRFHGIFDSAYELMGLLTPDGTLLEANRTALALVAARREDVIGKPFWETPWWKHSSTLQQELREQIARAGGGETVYAEADHWTPDGRQVWVEFTLKPVFDDRGRVTLIIPESRDITERKRAERALHETSSGLQAVFEASPAAIVVSSLEDGTYLEVNLAALEIFGYTREEAIGKSAVAINLWADVSQRKALVEEVKRNGEVRNQEVILRRKDGKLLTASVSARHIMFRGVECLLAVAEDITERKRAEAVLRESEARFRALFDLVPFSMAVHDGDGRIVDANATLLKRLEVHKEEMAGHLMSKFSTTSYTANPEETVADLQVLHDAVRSPIEAQVTRCADGRRRLVLISAATVPLGDRRDILTCAVDITDLKRAEEEKATLQAQLYQAQKMEAIGRLAAGVAHDFNNLLTVIGGYTQMSLTGLSEEDRMYQQLLEVSKAERRAEDLTHQLLAFSRSQAMEPTVVNLNSLIRETERMLRRLIGEDTTLAVNLTEAAPAVRADSGHLVQVLMPKGR
jgi:PAS domain S-box-containing protein